MPTWGISALALPIIVILLTKGGERAVFWVGLSLLVRALSLVKMAFMLTIVPLVLELSRPAPYVSRKLGVNEDIINRWIRQRIGDGVLGMREYVGDYLRRRRRLPLSVDKDSARAETIHYTTVVNDRYRTGEFIIAVVGGVVSLLASPFSFSIRIIPILSFYLVLLPISMALRTATVDVLMFDREAVNTVSGPELVFMKHWNKCIAEDEGMIAYHLLIGIAKGESEIGFELGKQVIEDVTVDDREFEDAMEDMVVTVLGEDALLPTWAKERLKKYRTGA